MSHPKNTKWTAYRRKSRGDKLARNECAYCPAYLGENPKYKSCRECRVKLAKYKTQRRAEGKDKDKRRSRLRQDVTISGNHSSV